MKKLLIVLFALLQTCGLFAGKNKDAEVRWCTFNIRVNSKVDYEKGCGWDDRKDRMCQWIMDNEFDVIGIQEATEAQMPDLIERLKGYDHIVCGRDKDRHGEATPLFFRHDKYDLLDSGFFWLSENPDEPGLKGWDAQCPRIVTWAKLRDKKTGKEFMAVNTHFDHKGKIARVESSKLLLKKMQILSDCRLPVVATADFNFTAESDAYTTMVGGAFIMNDAYRMSPKHSGVRYSYNGFTQKVSPELPKIDFIFITPGIRVMETGIEPHNPEAVLSDHCPHWAVLRF